jgi:ParB/RepB/Spo0J family partition protein
MLMSEQTHHTPVGEPRIVALSRIAPGEGFNPRQHRDPERFAQLVASVKADGILQPLLVTPDGESEGDGFRLIAGEGRWLAAGEAGQTEVPAYVVEVDARTGGLELALAENLARQDLDPVQEAHAYERLRAAGLTKKGIAERLGIAQRRVTERLELLKLPEALHPRIASGQIPPAAIKPLVALERIHPGLAACAVARVDAPAAHAWEEPLTWTDLVSDPIGVLLTHVETEEARLPDGVYDVSEAVPVSRFALGEAARGELEELCQLIQIPAEQFEVRFGREALERALALKAAHPAKSGWAHLLVGQDVADELAGDYIHACLANQRKLAEQRTQTSSSPGSAEGDETGEIERNPSEEELREARRAERAQAERERGQAHAFNAELGSALFKHLARLKVDLDVLKVLTAVEVAGDIDGVAARGARYTFPGWPSETTQRNGKSKVEYLDRPAAGVKAREFLSGADSLAETAGRLFCLIAAARYADERAVARSNRSMCSLRARDGLPYSHEVIDLIDDICAQRLPEHLTASVREQRSEQRRAVTEHERELTAARERLEDALTRAAELSEEEREAALADVEIVHGRYSIDGHRLRKQLRTPEAADPPASDAEAGDEDEAAQAA